MGWSVAVAFAVLTGSCAAGGLALLRHRATAVSGALLCLTAVFVLAGLIANAADADDTVRDALILAGAQLAFPLCTTVYPRPDLRHPVEFAGAATVGAAGLVAVLYARNADATFAMGSLSALAVLIRIWWRLERGPRAERAPLLWLALALGAAGMIAGIAIFAGEESDAGSATAIVVFAAVPPAMVIGRRRPEVVDVRGLIVQAVVSAVTMLLYLAVFVGVAAAMSGDGDANIGALGVLGAVCALGFHPTTVVLRGVVDQLLFGDRPDPLRAATRVVGRIGDDPELALRAIREALVLPYASLRADGVELASSGSAVTHTRSIALDLGGDSVGEMVVGLRAGDLRLSASDEHVLRIVAPLLAQTIRARALAADLQASRGEAIAAIEDERRRLRRDLHDGLGPTLTGVAFATDAARNKLRDDPSGADELLARLRADTADAIHEIRRLVEGLRPPALDELGLVAAVRQQARGLHTAAGLPLIVTIEAPDPMPALPAAVEVAAYRIVLEALTNVVRHAACDAARVNLMVDQNGLNLRVDDTGRNGAPWRPGVGMASMRERAEQVGGQLVTEVRPEGGRVAVTIPLG